MSPNDCYTPAVRNASGAPTDARVVDAHRAVRYDGLLQLIDEVQRRRSIEDVAQVAASRWKHCASVNNWRLLCVFKQRCALIVARGNQSTVSMVDVTQLPDFDAHMWARRIPRHLQGDTLAAERSTLPEELADAQGVALSVLPVQQGTTTIGLLSVLTFERPFDNLDRKFNALVAGAMASRVLSILTEQSLTAELMQVQKQLLEQRQASIMGRLVNGVAHELNTPLGVQIAACDALAAMVADSASIAECAQDITETVTLIDQQARRAARIVKRLQQISAASVAEAKALTPLREELLLIAESNGDLDIQVDCPASLHLTLDRHALSTVLGELLDNARVHGGCAHGAAPITLAVDSTPTAVCLRITDHGPGFAPEQVEHFFDPFFTSKLNQGHIGIGGYIAQNLARDALGATLSLESAPGRTEVMLTLPLA